MSDCPCCSGKTYSECCEAIIKNESATTALNLMRSRYTAYKNKGAELKKQLFGISGWFKITLSYEK